MGNYCVCCGEVIPEGRMVCPMCEYVLAKVPPGNYSKKIFFGENKRNKEKY